MCMQWVYIVSELAPYPKLIVLDESVSSLDLTLQIQLRDLRKCWVFTTHDLRLVRRFRDQVAVLPTAN